MPVTCRPSTPTAIAAGLSDYSPLTVRVNRCRRVFVRACGDMAGFNLTRGVELNLTLHSAAT